MSFSLQDLLDKQFHVRFRGFDVEEVDSFLELVAENYSMLIDDNKKMANQIESLTKELERGKNQEDSFRSAIVSAQKIADEMRKKSKDEANDLLNKAHEEIKALKDEAHKEVTELEARVEHLKGQQVKFENEIRTVIATYQKSLEEIPKVAEPENVASIASNEEEITADNKTEKKLTDTRPDFSDLYEKIDFGEDLAPASMAWDVDEKGDIDDEHDPDVEAGEANNIPDLDSDIMFTLHDPLDDDEEGIDVPISNDTEGK